MSSMQGKAHIPVEIWHNCWKDLPLAGLLALTQTCSLFRDICRPILFRFFFYLPTAEAMVLTGNITSEDYDKWEKKAMRFEDRVKWLLVDPTFAILPRICMFSGMAEPDLYFLGIQYPNGPLVYKSMLSAFKASLTSMKSLRIIRLEDIDIDEEVLNALIQLPLLKDVRLQSPNITCHKFLPLLAVEELSIMEWDLRTEYIHQKLELFSNKRLKVIDIQSYQYAPPILEHFIAQGRSEFLTSLRISVDIKIVPILMAFFETCPQLTSLSATSTLPEFYPAYPALSSFALPNLCTYNGIGSLAAVLIPSRPVKRITILDNWCSAIHEGRPASVLSQLVKSAAVIEHLSLPPLHPQPDLFHEILRTFPKLKSLELRFPLETDAAVEEMDNDSTPDDEYFDLTTANEIPPIEVDEEGSPIQPPTSMKGLLDWLCMNKLPLSPSITNLAILQQNRRTRGINHMFKTCISFREQYRLAGMLSAHFPALRSLTFGRQHIQWVYGDDGKWTPGLEFAFYIEHRGKIPRIAPTARELAT
ncbi:hypothetical protein CVT25_012447 [Psilocybe cyanescens]|uniref:F-box domain-containing protein n=1 Tax=Psilocybe cyanescens TaxID=93625 RepID=A0A409XC60_PSICY|nr:hypothetical protein CVT25_012447 [Psilocybe cyanescens]